MSDWTPLRQHLRADLERQIDAAILHGEDRELAAAMARQRERILERAVDAAELVALRRLMAEHDQDEHVNGHVVRLNGSKGLRQ